MDVLPLLVRSPRAFEIAKPLHLDKGVSFWDAMVIVACIDCGVQTHYLRRRSAWEPGITIVYPFA